MNHIQSLVELTRIGARACPELDSGMMLQVALEEELKVFLGRDYSPPYSLEEDTDYQCCGEEF
jgi:hypothetical protein